MSKGSLVKASSSLVTARTRSAPPKFPRQRPEQRRSRQGQRSEYQPARQHGPQRRVQTAPQVQATVRARPRCGRCGRRSRSRSPRLRDRRRGVRPAPRPSHRDLRRVHRHRRRRRRAQAGHPVVAGGRSRPAGRVSGVADIGREGAHSARAESPRPRRNRGAGVHRHPAREAPRGPRGHDRERRQGTTRS